MERVLEPSHCFLTPNRSQRRALAATALVVLGACAVLLLRQRGEPLAAAEAQPQGRASAGILVDVNRAQWPELSLVPGLGKALSQRIVDWRGVHGPFSSVDGLLAIHGIGRVKLDALRPYVTVGGDRALGGPQGERQDDVGVPSGQ